MDNLDRAVRDGIDGAFEKLIAGKPSDEQDRLRTAVAAGRIEVENLGGGRFALTIDGDTRLTVELGLGVLPATDPGRLN
jgi:hypothetical protein